MTIEPLTPGHRARATLLLSSAAALSDWEREFLRSIAQRFSLSDKQLAKLERIEARGTDDAPDPKVAFLDAMEAAGVIPEEPIADKLGPDKIRFQCKGDRKGRRNGWARFYSDGLPAGSFGNYKLQIAERWCMDDGRDLSPDERKRLAAEGRQRERERAAERMAAQLAVAQQCRILWSAAGPVDPAHGYLARKGISAREQQRPPRRLGARHAAAGREVHGLAQGAGSPALSRCAPADPRWPRSTPPSI